MQGERSTKGPAPRGGARPGPGAGAREIDSAALLAGEPMIRIRHASGIYTLRQTRQGKLILTK
jgi:hemin uptake protein HemP